MRFSLKTWRTNGKEEFVNRLPDDEISLPVRGRWEGVRNVVRFNWPLYAVGFAVAAAAFAMALIFPNPWWLAVGFCAGGAVATYFLLASLLVSLWVYDLSPLYQFKWARDLAGPMARRILNLHSGFDESSAALRTAFPDATFEVMDFYDASTMTEPSIARARRYQDQARRVELTAITRSVSSNLLPVDTGGIDTAFAILAAHEIRRPEDRLRFFTELARALCDGGRFILVEHLRNASNFLAFGPQFTHFYSRATWLQLAEDAGLTFIEESRITPFIGLFVFQKPHPAQP
jgi:SAM-dependent methyltransferase